MSIMIFPGLEKSGNFYIIFIFINQLKNNCKVFARSGKRLLTKRDKNKPFITVPRIRKRAAVISVVIFTLLIIEVVLRFFMGNLAVPYQINPGDGRCIGLAPDAALKYTGWYRRVPPVIHDTNCFGYRGRAYPQNRRPGTFRIAVLGDSFVYGMGVNRECAMPVFIEQYLSQASGSRDIEVLNFGIPGINLAESVEQYKFFARKWHPDLVLLLLMENDLSESLCSQYERPLATTLFRHVYLLRTAYLVYKLHAHHEKIQQKEKKQRLHRLLDSLGELYDLTGKNGAQAALVVLSNPLQKIVPLQSTTGELRIPTLDPGSGFWRDIAEVIPFEGHLTCRGNQAVGGVIAEWLMARGLTQMENKPIADGQNK